MTVDDARGRSWKLSRRMNVTPWKPRRRRIDPRDVLDAGGGDLLALGDLGGVIAGIAFAIVLVAFIAVLFPLLLFAAEVALVFALLVPLLFALALVGVRRHSVIAVCAQENQMLIRENVRFLWRSRSIMRDWAEQLRSSGQITDPKAWARLSPPPTNAGIGASTPRGTASE